MEERHQLNFDTYEEGKLTLSTFAKLALLGLRNDEGVLHAGG
jgi:hypothetical protein